MVGLPAGSGPALPDLQRNKQVIGHSPGTPGSCRLSPHNWAAQLGQRAATGEYVPCVCWNPAELRAVEYGVCVGVGTGESLFRVDPGVGVTDA